MNIATRPCAACTQPMVASHTWASLATELREQLLAARYRRAGARGLCINCYVAARNKGALPEYAPTRHYRTSDQDSDRVHGACNRCGVTAALDQGLCIDCVLVTSDLAELERWAS
jgi:ribosomal protein L37E